MILDDNVDSNNKEAVLIGEHYPLGSFGSMQI